MESIKLGLLMFCVLLATNLTLVQGLRKISQNQDLDFEMKLKVLNKPAIQSFQTKYGDILDCVEVHKQLAFDHPLLKNHSLQMKPNIPTLGRPSSSPRSLKASLGLAKNIRCPKGSVLVKRVQKEDLLMAKFSQSFGMKFHHQAKGANQQVPPGHYVAALAMAAANSKGVHGRINVWDPTVVGNDQYSSAFTYVGSEDGTQIANGIAAGWTKDSGRSTGCFNILCPGFVQVSKEITLGLIMQPLSILRGQQYDIEIGIMQDKVTGNWWLRFESKEVGYYPKELFTTMAEGASNGGWGGEVASPEPHEPTPAMGSGDGPETGWGYAAYIRQMFMIDHNYVTINPDNSTLQQIMTIPRCYKASFAGYDSANDSDYYMFFGGPPQCFL